ncbi:winged helix-turn-helix domain-containing protein [Anaerosphaera multitolerans]|uniref:LysR family transcriptional regulator n=1 Tax=Anaerosphaera multitolerans TaxID=2487351 RepID=A0A437S541_9FIRM|nr:LysR family transcriptional regulator [Anaerosphaera multitolerans]RVU54129.1 LysR family transcriptional regulator [Anaerosphaera multitolerans]
MSVAVFISCISQKDSALALKKIGKNSILRRTVFMLKDLGMENIYVLIGEKGKEISKDLMKSGATVVNGIDYKNYSNFESEILAMERFYNYYDYTLYLTLEPYFLNRPSIEKLLDSKNFSIGSFKGKELNMALLPNSYYSEIKGNFNNIIDAFKNISGEYSKLSLTKKEVFESELRCNMKLTIFKDEKFFGPGVAKLLRLVDETGSVKFAAQSMNISYSKAWKMINTMEDELEFLVIDRKPGGSGGGESNVTEKGREFLSKYELLVKNSRAYTIELFKEIFENYNGG